MATPAMLDIASGGEANVLLTHGSRRIKGESTMLINKRVEGTVEYNDGEFAEVLTYGIEGIEKDLLLEAIQIHREDTEDMPEDFQRRFPAGRRLSIVTSTEITTV
jgi:hypothetical protein